MSRAKKRGVERARRDDGRRTSLALRAAGGDRAAGEELLGEVLPWFHRLAGRYTRCDAEAWDIAQEAAARLWAALPRFDPARGRFEALARAVLRNQAVTAWRARRRRPASLAGAPEAADRRDDPALAAERDEECALLADALADLDPPAAAAVRLRLEGVSYREAAAALGSPLGTVATRVARAKDRLRARLRGGAAGRRDAA